MLEAWVVVEVSPIVSNPHDVFILAKGWIQLDYKSHEESLAIS